MKIKVLEIYSSYPPPWQNFDRTQNFAYGFDLSCNTVPADLVAYGKAKVVFHLNDIGGVIQDVQAMIEARREEKARESDDAMGQIIKAAIQKNPAAQSLADMLDSIEDANDIWADDGAVEKCKAQLKAKIEGSDFAQDLRDQIFIGIWRLHGEPKGDSSYGLHHYLDDLELLSQVLINIVTEIGLNGEQ